LFLAPAHAAASVPATRKPDPFTAWFLHPDTHLPMLAGEHGTHPIL
jgi:hypothetical protein